MRFSKSILLTAAALAMPFLGHANTLSVGNLTLSNFACTFTYDGSGSPDGCNDIAIKTITQPGTGIEFASGFSAYGKGSFTDAQINYNVHSTTGVDLVGLDFNGDFFGQAIASVTESIFNNGKQVGFASVACGSGKAGCTMTDNIMLSGSYDDLYIQKDIFLASYSKGSGSYASYVDQTFADAPEPSSIALLGGGLFGAFGLLRRRKLAVKA